VRDRNIALAQAFEAAQADHRIAIGVAQRRSLHGEAGPERHDRYRHGQQPGFGNSEESHAFLPCAIYSRSGAKRWNPAKCLHLAHPGDCRGWHGVLEIDRCGGIQPPLASHPRLLEVGNQVAGVLETDRQAQQVLGCFGARRYSFC
jgi:hypothetical protein